MMDYRWQKSSFSNGSGGNNCVEVRDDETHIEIRNSKYPVALIMQFTYEEWFAFVAGVKAGEFDL